MTGQHLWPRNTWGAPRGIPFVTRWLTRRAHQSHAAEMRRGWDEGFTRAAARLPEGLTYDELRRLTCDDTA